jgi:cell division inhibitor SepF
MSSLFSKALLYLGLVDEDSAPGDEPEPVAAAEAEGRRSRPIAPEGRRVEPPASTARTSPRGETLAGVRTIRPHAQTDILVVEEFSDARVLADRVRDQIPVVVDLRHADTDLGRRVIDFSSGLIYALDGKMKKVGDALVLVTPRGVDLSTDEKQRLARLGAYEIDLDA